MYPSKQELPCFGDLTEGNGEWQGYKFGNNNEFKF